MRSVLVVMLAAVPSPMFADFAGSGGGGPSPAPKAAPKTDPGPSPTPSPALRAGAGTGGQAVDPKIRALVEDATRWLVGSPAGRNGAVTLPRASLADAIRANVQAEPAGNGSGAPAFGGGWSAGIVIAPEPHPDARPWPLGMVIEAPDVNDPIAIPPGCDGLQPRPPRRVTSGWRKLFADLARKADAACPQVKVAL